MSARAKDREQFIADAVRHGMLVSDARLFLRYAATMQRYAEWDCNEEWWCNPSRPKRCAVCEQDRPAGYTMQRVATKAQREMSGFDLSRPGPIYITVCKPCRVDELAHAAARRISDSTGPNVLVELQGDPRECLITLVFAEGTLGVPS